MSKQYVISDNQYFSAGVASLIPGQACVSLIPEDITGGLKKITSGVVLIYIKDRKKFRAICHYLSFTECELIFFFDANPGLEAYNFVSTRFWNARLPVSMFCNRIPGRLSDTGDDTFNRMPPARRQRVFMAAKGLKYFHYWVSEKTTTKKGQHNYGRSLLQIMGIYNVSVHNLSLAEGIALAWVTIYQTEVLRKRLHLQPENNSIPAGLIKKGNLPGHINL
ncbi:hypothetical protein DYI69_19555 [Salmonella enterica]|nr:hypothetical protein [Salmonella enterica]